jgi:DTW domain-containing protein YfiP
MQASEPIREPRAVCERCRRPHTACYCAHLPELASRTKVVVLQHPRERDMAIGTARLAHLCLPNSELHVGAHWESSSELRAVLADPSRRAILLYPTHGAVDVAELSAGKPLTLVVVDGTWPNAKKMVERNPVLAALPRVAFQPPRPSEYRIRKEPKPHCVSTVEALAHVLGVLEGDAERFQGLLEPFHRMIDRQIELKTLHRTGARRRAKIERRPVSIPKALAERTYDVICVVGEANAWPYCGGDSREKYPDELVHWAACRMATGETFEFVVRPKYPLAPNTVKHIQLTAEQLSAGGSVDELCARWRAFVRDTDILCSWGCYGTGLLQTTGGFLPNTRFDLRHLTKDLLKRKLGTMEQWLEAIGGQASGSLCSGRAGMRLAQLSAITRCICEGQLPTLLAPQVLPQPMVDQ